MTENVEQEWISGFWRRIGALVVDTLILGIVGMVLGLFFESIFVQLGGYGRLVGFSIALIYFGIMNSSITGGQTIGKKLLKLRVVDSNNSPIHVGKSVLRYFILALPFSLNGAQFSDEAISSFLMYPLSLIIFGGMLSIFYLYIFNRVTRQSLHDLVVGTYVVNINVEKKECKKVWNIHMFVVAVLYVFTGVLPAFTASLLASENFNEMRKAQVLLSNRPDVAYATISKKTATTTSTKQGTKTTNYVSSQVFLENNNIDDVELARQFATMIIENYPEAITKDSIQIVLTHGYDIGIAARWSRYPHRFKPAEL